MRSLHKVASPWSRIVRCTLNTIPCGCFVQLKGVSLRRNEEGVIFSPSNYMDAREWSKLTYCHDVGDTHNNFHSNYFLIRIGVLYSPYRPISLQHWSWARPEPVNGIRVLFPRPVYLTPLPVNWPHHLCDTTWLLQWNVLDGIIFIHTSVCVSCLTYTQSCILFSFYAPTPIFFYFRTGVCEKHFRIHSNIINPAWWEPQPFVT